MVVGGLAVGGLAVSGAGMVEKWLVVDADRGWVAWWKVLVPSIH